MNQNNRDFYDALFAIVGFINQPHNDRVLLAEAGVSLDRALFPLLVLIGRHNSIGIVELAGLVGRDHSTVSRQVATLVRLELVTRRPGDADGRERKVSPTAQGLTMLSALDAARERLLRPIVAQWGEHEWGIFVGLLRRFAQEIIALRKQMPDTTQETPSADR